MVLRKKTIFLHMNNEDTDQMRVDAVWLTVKYYN